MCGTPEWSHERSRPAVLGIALEGRRCQLGTGFTGAVDGDTRLLLVLRGGNVEQYIPQNKAHGPRDPVSSNHTESSCYEAALATAASHQKPTTKAPTLRCGRAGDKALNDRHRGETFVLPHERIQRKANNGYCQKQPTASGGEVGMERMRQSQAKAQPYSQWQEERINGDEPDSVHEWGKSCQWLHG